MHTAPSCHWRVGNGEGTPSFSYLGPQKLNFGGIFRKPILENTLSLFSHRPRRFRDFLRVTQQPTCKVWKYSEEEKLFSTQEGKKQTVGQGRLGQVKRRNKINREES